MSTAQAPRRGEENAAAMFCFCRLMSCSQKRGVPREIECFGGVKFGVYFLVCVLDPTVALRQLLCKKKTVIDSKQWNDTH